MKKEFKKLVISIIVLLAAGVSPNLYVISQAGYANLSDLALSYLIPSMAVITVIFITGFYNGFSDLSAQIKNGIFAGIIATVGLEIIREIGYHLGGMPGDMPKLLGVLLLDRFAYGPDLISNIAGWSYHFWNGASFGIIYSVVFGKGRIWFGLIYALIIGTIFMVSPAAVALGVGYFGVDFGWGFPVTVILAHTVFGLTLGWFIFNRNKMDSSIFDLLKHLFRPGNKNAEDMDQN